MNSDTNVITVDRMDAMLRVLLRELKSRGGSANGSDVLAAIEPKLKLSPYEVETTETGKVRWETHVRFYTSDCVRAGLLTKNNGIWTLTPKGEDALNRPPGQLVREAQRESRKSRRSEKGAAKPDDVDLIVAPDPEKLERQTIYEQAKEQARKEIDARIDALGPYDFQRMVEELLRAMGYHVPFNAPPGPDGGIDLIAYKDPLGTVAPRIKVQVKHRDSKVAAPSIRELESLLRKEGDIGLIVSSGGFSADAMREIRSSTKHIETMDQDRLIQLWQEHYETLSESGKALLPLVKVHFLAPEED